MSATDPGPVAPTATTRRALLRGAAGLAAWRLAGPAPAAVAAEASRPAAPSGLQIGDVVPGGAVVWSRSDRPARLFVEWDTDERFARPRRLRGPLATAAGDFTAQVDLAGLPAAATLFVRAWFEAADDGTPGPSAAGRWRTPSAAPRDLSFAWSGDQAGQGWGINLEWGGFRIFEAIRRLGPDFFVHCGDQIYADQAIPATRRLADGTLWHNLTSPAKDKVAETLADYHGNYAYNLLDPTLRRFNAEVPRLVIWDDHEVRNDWYPGRVFPEDRRYAEPRADVLAARGRQAFFDYNPVRRDREEVGRIHRAIPCGPLLDLFLLDGRSYRGPNPENAEADPARAPAFLGAAQVRWLLDGLARGRGLWKVIAGPTPLGLVIPDRGGGFDGVGNGDGLPLGREIEIAGLLAAIKRAGARNVVWLAADVHYAAAHHFAPQRAAFADLLPFWEFTAGPLHAATFGGRQPLDDTFGAERRFATPPPPGSAAGPAEGSPSFGTVAIAAASGTMTVRLHGLDGGELYAVDIAPA